MWYHRRMNTSSSPCYKHHRFPVEIISHAVWLYFRFSLSYRDVEELMAARGIVLTYETIRQWCQKFGQKYANQVRRRRAQTGDKWHLDEVFLTINGKLHYLWGIVKLSSFGRVSPPKVGKERREFPPSTSKDEEMRQLVIRKDHQVERTHVRKA
jgi:hypothetical protein